MKTEDGRDRRKSISDEYETEELRSKERLLIRLLDDVEGDVRGIAIEQERIWDELMHRGWKGSEADRTAGGRRELATWHFRMCLNVIEEERESSMRRTRKLNNNDFH